MMPKRNALREPARPRSPKNYRLDVLLFMTLVLLLFLFLGFSVAAK
jgi:hypothetical protein